MIPNYMKQLFCHVIQKTKTQKKLKIISSEFKLLNTDLQNVLLSIQDSTQQIKLSSFMNTLIKDPMRIKVMTEYLWVLSDKELKKLKKSKPDALMYRNVEMIYPIEKSNNKVIKFNICICRCMAGSNYAGYGIKIIKSPTGVAAYWSIMIDEANWIKNGDSSKNLSSGMRKGRLCFIDSLLDDMSSLTIRIAIRFHR